MKINCGPIIYTYHIGMNVHHLSHLFLGLCVCFFFFFLLIKCMKENLWEQRVSQHCGSSGCILCVEFLNYCTVL